MTDDPSTYIPVVALTKAELERFRKNAPAALARRGAGFVLEQLASSGGLVLTGLVPLVGALAYDWSPLELVLFLLVGVWSAIVCDLFKWAALHAVVASEARELEEHRRVWLVVDALRKQQEEARAAIAKYPPGVGLFLDLSFGSASAVVLIALLIESQPQSLGLLFQAPGFVLSLVGLIAYELGLTIWIVLHHWLGGGRKRPVRIDAGLRGVGLLLLLAMTATVGSLTSVGRPEARASASVTILVASGWFVLLGALYALSTVFALREAAWLRAYLRLGRGGSNPRANRAQVGARRARRGRRG